MPGAQRELQAAVVAVSGVDRPVAAGLARGDRVPVDAVGIRGSGAQGNRGDRQGATDDSHTDRLGGNSSTCFLSLRAPGQRPRGGRWIPDGEVAGVSGACRLGQARQRRQSAAPQRQCHPAIGRSNGSGTNPAHTRSFSLFSYLIPLRVAFDSTDGPPVSHIGRVGISFRSRDDHSGT